MNQDQLTLNEKYIVETLRALNPFERVEIVADSSGKLNHFIVLRTTKVILSEEKPIYAVYHLKI